MKFRNLLIASGSALALSAAGALADNNYADLLQQGSGNSALIDQGMGSGNWAGNPLSVPGDNNRIRQRGSDHVLTISQQGNNNRAGRVVNGIFQGNNDVSSDHTLTINQLSDGNHVNAVTQSQVGSTATITQSNGDNNVLTYLRQGGNNHSATIAQTGEGNWIGSFNATSRTASPGTAVQQLNSENALTITQMGNFNRLSELVQHGNFNEATVSVTGDRNVIGRVRQGPSGASGNTVTMMIDGNENGASAAAASTSGWGPSYRSGGAFSAGSLASMVAVPSAVNGTSVGDIQSGSNQIGSNNTLDFSVNGDRTQFLFLQGGDGNIATGTVSSDDNQLAIVQLGDTNTADSLLAGDNNDVGISQNGNDNNASAMLTGASNGVLVDQFGNDNTANVTITGDFNGAGLFFTGGSAAELAAGGLASGSVIQMGDLNTTNLTIFGDQNAFALSSTGAGNTITGTVGSSSANANGNQVAVAQVGNSHVATFTQIGSGNNAGILQ